MDEMEDYLEEGFDPRSVTMARLRGMLMANEIDYPSTAKKAQLVDIVNEKLLPQAAKLRARRARAKRSSLGIVNAGSAEDTPGWAEQDLAPPKSKSRASKSPRKSSARIKSEEPDEEPATGRKVSSRSVRSTSRALSYTDEYGTPEYEQPKPARRVSRRTVTPQIKEEEDEDDEDAEVSFQDEMSVFTDDNPFQSGSSPPTIKSNTHRRQTSGASAKSMRSSRRQTSEPEDEEDDDDQSFNFSRSKRGQSPQSALEPTEEFTPDEQLELEEAASKGELQLPPRPRRTKRKSGLWGPLYVAMVTVVGVYATWYRQEKVAVGYCGLGRSPQQILPPEIMEHVPDAAIPLIEPQCAQCPSHAYCYEDFSVRCEPDFILKPHPLSLGGLVPLPPTCEPDGEKARRIQAVADKAIEELRERRAKFECGDLVDEQGQQVDSPAIDEEELKATVSRKRSKRLNKDEFDDLWAAALGEVTSRDEVQVQTAQASHSSSFTSRRFESTSLARLSITCAVKRSFRLGLERYRLAVGFLIAVAMGLLYLRSRYRKYVATTAQIPALVDLVMERLANQKELGEEDIDDPWLFLPNLRDDVLRSIHSLSERERIWRRVKPVVEHNSNVRTSQREGRSGEVGRAWEWIGPVAGEGARRRRSGRVSWGPDVKAETPEPQEMVQSKKWEESRPIY